jgi:hemolysin III
VANTLTHGFGLLLSIGALVFLASVAIVKSDIWFMAGSLIYGLSLVVLYAASTLYHGATTTARKKVLQIVDHCCIYLLIAGSYTPFTLLVLRPGMGEKMFIFVWVFAFLGIAAKLAFGKRFKVISVASYLVMGWIGAFAIEPLFAALGLMPIVLIIAGGLAYSVGVIFYASERIRHHHAIWHLFVLAGSVLHFLAVALYVIPFAQRI